ncbi:MAG: nucleotidyl transferase AbiEii/AbiGii toxin family protein [Acholeplasmatales bacterium]|nr:nucleotidyl transferase AbiEii/AbiGii toxin family protein [Acholeplasmatales bacterium]
MIKLLNRSIDEINEVVEATSRKSGLASSIVEKDLWVCYILDYLFNRCEYKDFFEFKGGTSLSKAYNLIDRMSEDIDIVLNSRIIDFNFSKDLFSISNNQKNKLVDELNNRALEFYKGKLLQVITNDLSNEINKQLKITLSDEELAIYVEYPSSYNTAYIKNAVKIEIGPVASWTPYETKTIKSYASTYYPSLFNNVSFNVRVTLPVRTFWEKAVILHQEANRENGKIPQRYSRHYYDLFKMYYSNVKSDALNNLGILEDVRLFTMTFYNRPWAKFEEARPGTFKLIPKNLDDLKNDYKMMEPMFFKDYPSFDEIVKVLEKLENEINGVV